MSVKQLSVETYIEKAIKYFIYFISELPIDLNGYNKSLTNPVRLFEVKDSMSVSYQTTFAGRDTSTFTMKFIYSSEG